MNLKKILIGLCSIGAGLGCIPGCLDYVYDSYDSYAGEWSEKGIKARCEYFAKREKAQEKKIAEENKKSESFKASVGEHRCFALNYDVNPLEYFSASSLSYKINEDGLLSELEYYKNGGFHGGDKIHLFFVWGIRELDYNPREDLKMIINITISDKFTGMPVAVFSDISEALPSNLMHKTDRIGELLVVNIEGDNSVFRELKAEGYRINEYGEARSKKKSIECYLCAGR